MDAAVFDADGDGDIDILIAIEFRENIILINDGEGKFTDESDERLPRNSRDSEDIGIADLDNDGDSDVIIVSEDDRINEFYLNDGNGYFTDVSERIIVQGTSNAVAVADINDDGSPDIFIGLGRNFRLNGF